MALIINDPTLLISGGDSGTTFNTPLSLNTTTKVITITPGSGILPDSADGVTGQALYSALKLLWKNNTTYIKFPFPMEAITPEQFEFISGWAPSSDVTRKSLRNCGWVERKTDGTITKSYSGIVSLGSLGLSDQPYYQQNSETEKPVNFSFPGPVNEAVSIRLVSTCSSTTDVNNSSNTFTNNNHGFSNGDKVKFTTSGVAPVGLTNNNYYYIVNKTDNTFKVESTIGGGEVDITSDGTGDQTFTKDSTSFMKLFAREYQKTYASSQLSDIGVTEMTYIVYRFPLANAADSLKITHNDGVVSGSSPYTETNITWVRDSSNNYVVYNVRGDWATSTAYALSDVVKGTDDHWYKCILAHTSTTGTKPITGGSYSSNWASYEGERQLGTNYYPFTIIIDADTDVGINVSGDARLTEIYEKIQYQLRQSTDIDAGSNGTVIGKTATNLLRFVGDTLVTSPGVFIESLNSNDINNVQFYDSTNTQRTFPFVAAGTLTFNSNLISDASAIFRMYFTTLPGSADFGTSNAVLVKDSLSNDISGLVNGNSSISFSFAYDSNNQGGRTPGTDANITIVAIGLATGQYVSTTATITRSSGQNISLVSSLERNYINP